MINWSQVGKVLDFNTFYADSIIMHSLFLLCKIINFTEMCVVYYDVHIYII
jgi:hypothetical protein